MNKFTIKDIENLSGIKAHTWRIWEQRYGIGIPQRKDSNHRYYDNENLKQVLRISYLYHSGLKVSKIASLGHEQIRQKALEHLPKENEYEFYVKELLEASIDLDEDRFERLLQEAMMKMSVTETMINVLYTFQEKIGVLWLTDHVIPAQEHFTSNIIRRKLTVAIDELPMVNYTLKKTVLLFTPRHEQHELPLQLIHYLLKKNNTKVVYFGKDVSLKELDVYLQSQPADILLFHLLTLLKTTATAYLEELSRLFPGKEIIMTGPLTKQITNIPSNIRFLASMDEVINFCSAS